MVSLIVPLSCRAGPCDDGFPPLYERSEEHLRSEARQMYKAWGPMIAAEPLILEGQAQACMQSRTAADRPVTRADRREAKGWEGSKVRGGVHVCAARRPSLVGWGPHF